MAEEIPEYLRRILDRVALLEDRFIELSDRVDDIDRRLMLVETLLAPAGAGLPTGSRWVLEIFPEEIEDWRRALRTIPLEALSERERSFLRSMDYYIVSERKITLPQLIWLTIIKRKAGGVLPEIPLVTAPKIETHSSPHQEAEAELPLTEEVEGYAIQELTKPKKCALCGASIPEGFTFCPKCYAPVVEET
ncbi:MAG: zinc ribbon domain-containing protein [Candidatus Bathyarchaeia archaeon]